jgi:ketosteroid isomerase-like protein
MKRIFLAAAMSLSSAFIAFGQTAHNKSAHHAREEQAVREVEDKITAALGSNDADALDRLWASDYIFVNPFGIVMTKAQRLTTFRSGNLNVESYSRDEENIRVYGDMAVVIYRSTVKGRRGGQDIGSQRRVTTVLVKRSGRWQVVSQQSTRIAQQ